MITNIGRTEMAVLTNKSGGLLAYGSVVIVDTANAAAFNSTTTAGYVSGRVGVVIDPGGIANNAPGLVAFSGWVPRINLDASASIGDMIKSSTVAGQGTPHASPLASGDFAQVIGSGTTPQALLFGSPISIVSGAGVYFAPSGLTGATAASRYVGATAAGAPVSGTFSVGDFVISQTGTIYICTIAGSPGTWAAPSGGGGEEYILVQDQKASGTDGGTFTSGSWIQRNINTEVVDAGGYCTVASNQITLLAGTYRFRITCPGYRCGEHRNKLYNVTDAVDVALGTSSYTGNTMFVQTMTEVVGKMTIAGTKTFQVQHRCAVTANTNGLGVKSSMGTEVYTSAEFWRS